MICIAWKLQDTRWYIYTISPVKETVRYVTESDSSEMLGSHITFMHETDDSHFGLQFLGFCHDIRPWALLWGGRLSVLRVGMGLRDAFHRTQANNTTRTRQVSFNKHFDIFLQVILFSRAETGFASPLPAFLLDDAALRRLYIPIYPLTMLLCNKLKIMILCSPLIHIWIKPLNLHPNLKILVSLFHSFHCLIYQKCNIGARLLSCQICWKPGRPMLQKFLNYQITPPHPLGTLTH